MNRTLSPLATTTLLALSGPVHSQQEDAPALQLQAAEVREDGRTVRAELGFLSVPMRYDDPDSGEIELAVLVRRSTSSDPGPPTFFLNGIPDGATDLSDLFFFLNTWQADLGAPTPNPGSLADVTTTGTGSGDPGHGLPDGTVDLADLLYFLGLWQGGTALCP